MALRWTPKEIKEEWTPPPPINMAMDGWGLTRTGQAGAAHMEERFLCITQGEN